MVGSSLFVVGFVLALSQASARPEFALLPSPPPLQDNPKQACLQCHGNQAAKPPEGNTGDPRAPLWDNFYSMEWDMYELDPAVYTPPVLDIPADRLVSHGKTYYDWTKKKMLEVYEDRCIAIFSAGNDFSCKFLSLADSTYLIRYDLGDIRTPRSCCKFEGPFWAPRPDVLRNMGFQHETSEGRLVTQWWLLDSPLPGPFGYGTSKRSKQPVAFWFPVIGAWVQQNFSKYSNNRPPPAAFTLPALCRKAATCEEP